MTKVIAQDRNYSGVSASVPFTDGIGYTDNPRLLKWLREHGYTVVEEAAEEVKPKTHKDKSKKKK